MPAPRGLQERPAMSPVERSETSLPARPAIEDLRPQLDGGRFPIKRIVGSVLSVSADIHADGHDRLGGVLQYRHVGDPTWREAPLRDHGDDRWEAEFPLDRLGVHEYRIE